MCGDISSIFLLIVFFSPEFDQQHRPVIGPQESLTELRPLTGESVNHGSATHGEKTILIVVKFMFSCVV